MEGNKRLFIPMPMEGSTSSQSVCLKQAALDRHFNNKEEIDKLEQVIVDTSKCGENKRGLSSIFMACSEKSVRKINSNYLVTKTSTVHCLSSVPSLGEEILYHNIIDKQNGKIDNIEKKDDGGKKVEIDNGISMLKKENKNLEKKMDRLVEEMSCKDIVIEDHLMKRKHQLQIMEELKKENEMLSNEKQTREDETQNRKGAVDARSLNDVFSTFSTSKRRRDDIATSSKRDHGTAEGDQKDHKIILQSAVENQQIDGVDMQQKKEGISLKQTNNDLLKELEDLKTLKKENNVEYEKEKQINKDEIIKTNLKINSLEEERNSLSYDLQELKNFHSFKLIELSTTHDHNKEITTLPFRVAQQKTQPFYKEMKKQWQETVETLNELTNGFIDALKQFTKKRFKFFKRKTIHVKYVVDYLRHVEDVLEDLDWTKFDEDGNLKPTNP